ncbi:hypothetical protein BX589_10172 [Paraburkholderia fungorum]|jgi:hypothetical protein|nr:hypothetical protein BX589_10172 [Paraburkholderia fungorum]
MPYPTPESHPMIAFTLALQSALFLPFLHATISASASIAAALVVFVIAFCSLGTLAWMWALLASPMLALGGLLAFAAHELGKGRNA